MLGFGPCVSTSVLHADALTWLHITQIDVRVGCFVNLKVSILLCSTAI